MVEGACALTARDRMARIAVALTGLPAVLCGLLALMALAALLIGPFPLAPVDALQVLLARTLGMETPGGPGETVLLSPGYSSHDQFANFTARGLADAVVDWLLAETLAGI